MFFLVPSGQMKRLCALQYSLWLDQHSMADALKYIKAALEACAPAAKSEAGYEDIYPLMYKLCVHK